MKKIILLLAISIMAQGVAAQSKSDVTNPCAAVLRDEGGLLPDTSLAMVEPSYPDGINAFYKYVSDNLEYPSSAKGNISGTVVLKFIVEKNGRISNIEIAQSLNKAIDSECVKVLKKSPRWNAGTVGGKAARFTYCLPIEFKY